MPRLNARHSHARLFKCQEALRFINDPLKPVAIAGGSLIPMFAKTFAETRCEC